MLLYWYCSYCLGVQFTSSKLVSDLGFNQAGKGGELTHDETTIIAGALQLTEKTAGDAMTPISETFAIDINATLDRYNLLVCVFKKALRWIGNHKT